MNMRNCINIKNLTSKIMNDCSLQRSLLKMSQNRKWAYHITTGNGTMNAWQSVCGIVQYNKDDNKNNKDDL